MNIKVLFVLFLATFEVSKCDLPVHCLAKDVAGSWTFYLDSEVTDKEGECGHARPDRNTDHVNEVETANANDIRLSFQLNLPNIVSDSSGSAAGYWTMVYDEGFSIEALGYTFFAFSKYQLNKGTRAKDTDDEQTIGYYSDCSKTFKGWFTFNGKFGCFFGEKNTKTSNDVPKDNAIVFHGIIGQKIVQRDDSNKGEVSQNSQNKNSLFAAPQNGPTIFESQSSLEAKNGPVDFSDNKQLSLFDKFQSNIPIYNVPHNNYMTDPSSHNDNMPFTPDYSFIELVNSNSSKLPWKAKAHDSFLNKTHGQMKKLIGMNSFKQLKYKISESQKQTDQSFANFTFLEINSRENFKIRAKGNLKRGTHAVYENCVGNYDNNLPKCFDWRNVDKVNYDTPIKSQGDCGSCYAEAFLSAFESRIRIKTKMSQKPFFSTASVISCSRENQGCNGGYPWLVGKFGRDIGFVETQCNPFVETDKVCDESCYTRSRVWKVSKFGYIGKDFYGSTNEEAMMKEIYENGPIVIAFNAAPDLYYYSYGVFITNPQQAFMEGNNRDDIKPWQFTNHAVVCVGWGESEHEGKLLKYWIFKNSWGEEWGEGGYFRILRGINLGAVENQAVYAEPDLSHL